MCSWGVMLLWLVPSPICTSPCCDNGVGVRAGVLSNGGAGDAARLAEAEEIFRPEDAAEAAAAVLLLVLLVRGAADALSAWSALEAVLLLRLGRPLRRTPAAGSEVRAAETGFRAKVGLFVSPFPCSPGEGNWPSFPSSRSIPSGGSPGVYPPGETERS